MAGVSSNYQVNRGVLFAADEMCVTTTEVRRYMLRAAREVESRDTGLELLAARKDFSRAWSCRFLFRPGNLPWPIFSVLYPLIRADYICFNHGQRKLENFLPMERRSVSRNIFEIGNIIVQLFNRGWYNYFIFERQHGV